MRIGIDLMGGDTPPATLFDAILRAAEQFSPACSYVVIATSAAINEIQQLYSSRRSLPFPSNIEFKRVLDVISMTEEPLYAISHKKNSSLVVGIRLLKKRQLDALISAGNTGALLACAALQLPHLPGIRRPALLVVAPTLKGSVAILDVGGNVSCKAHHLVQFAKMGAAFQNCSQEIPTPKIGLLNIGAESIKGTPIVRQAYQILQELSAQEEVSESPKMQFLGNIEGREVFQGKVDVIITDGFTGNVLLKTSEGIASVIFESLQNSLQAPVSPQLQGVLNQVRRPFNHTEYPGAILCGLEGVVIKCHGNASPEAIFNSIKGAIKLVENQFIAKMKMRLE